MANSARQKARIQQTKRQTRAQRSAAQSIAARQQAQQPQSKKSSRPRSQTLGGLITLLIVLGVAAYAVIRSQQAATTTHTAGPPLTNPSALASGGNMLSVGTRAPGFVLRDANGKAYSLAVQQGHPVVLEFFAVWCPHCQQMAPIMQRLANTYKAKGVRTWMILANPYGPNYDSSFGQDTTPATKADLTSFTRTYHESLPKLVDPNFSVVNTYKLNGYPGIYVVDKNGVISYASSGEVPYSKLSTAVGKALASK